MSIVEKYDSVVVGAGAGGLSMALVLALSGRRRILVVEKSERPGGALGSFHRSGVRLDAGFHFAGAMHDGGLFDSVSRLLGLRDAIRPVFLDSERANVFNFESSGRSVEFPYGLERLRTSLKAQFPGECLAVDRYFDTIERVRLGTPTLDLATAHLSPRPLAEDFVTLKEYLEGVTENRLLRETLSALVMCHGSAPSEISMADNARLCQGFYESVATLDGGGTALVDAFLARLAELGVEIACSEEVVGFAEVSERRVGRFLLKSGREVAADETVFTLNPKTVASILPRGEYPPAFFHRIDSFESSPGFFTVFATLEDDSAGAEGEGVITSSYPVDDIDALSLPGWEGPGGLAITFSRSSGKRVMTAFEPLYWESVSKWSDSSVGDRPLGYERWKREKTDEILARVATLFPSCRGKMELVTSCTPLTYRDYLYHHHGAAYGIKHKVGQMNLMGRSRLRNVYFAGQSAVLPGVLGTIAASLLVAKNIFGDAEFADFVAMRCQSGL